MELVKLIIHSMNVSDLNKIKDTLEENFNNFWNYEIFRNELENNNSSYLVAEYDGEIVCYGGIKIILDEAELMNIVTKVNMRNMGFAKKVLNELITVASEHGCVQINLEVNEHNESAIHLYESFGFKQVGLRKKYYDDIDNAILMTLKI